jgi:hypothetical protein
MTPGEKHLINQAIPLVYRCRSIEIACTIVLVTRNDWEYEKIHL